MWVNERPRVLLLGIEPGLASRILAQFGGDLDLEVAEELGPRLRLHARRADLVLSAVPVPRAMRAVSRRSIRVADTRVLLGVLLKLALSDG